MLVSVVDRSPVSKRAINATLIFCAIFAGTVAGVDGAASAASFRFFNTGVANDGSLLSSNMIDPHYRIVGSAAFGPAAYVKTEADGFPITPGVWLLDNATSRYLVPSTNFFFADVPTVTDRVTYRTTFDLTGFDPATAALSGRLTADDTIASLTLNGIEVPHTYVFNSQWNPLDITAGFVAGINTLEFTTLSTLAPTGLRVELTGSATTVAEPASWGLMIGGFGLVGAAARRRRVTVAA